MRFYSFMLVFMLLPAVYAVDYVNHEDPVINLSFQDKVEITEADINGTTVNFLPEGSAYDFVYQSSLSDEGQYSLKLKVTDDHNRRFESDVYEHIFVIDTTRPDLLVSSPAEDEKVILSESEFEGELKFSEILRLITVDLIKDGQTVELTSYEQTSDGARFSADIFESGDYELSFYAEDIAGNIFEDSVSFTLLKDLEVKMLGSTYLGALPAVLMFRTNEDAACKIAVADDAEDPGPEEFSDMETGDGKVHEYALDFLTPGQAKIFVVCSLADADLEVSESYDIVFDNTPPVMKITAADITDDFTPSQVSIDLDEKSTCSYSEISFDDPNAKKLSGGTFSEHFRIETFVEDNKNYVYYIKCTNLAGLSSTGKAEFFVKKYLNMSLEITEPEDGPRSSSRVTIKAKTSKNAVCGYYTSENQTAMYTGTFGEDGRNHISDEIALDLGETVIFVACEAPVSQTETVSMMKFVKVFVDETEPELDIIRIKPDNRTWTATKIRVDVEGTDNESDIIRYKYRIISAFSDYSSGWINEERSGFILDKDSRGNVLNLTNGTYFVEVKVQNAAGLWSDTKKSEAFVIEPLNKPEQCENKKLDIGKETDIDCGGNCGPCKEGRSCTLNSDCASGYCENTKCVVPTCYDGKKNQKESDVDCGGPCDPCVDGKACVSGSDCSSGSCRSRRCVEVSPCMNGLKDEGEADTDCGAICAHKNRLCSDYKSCMRDADCISGNCDDNFCKPKEPEKTFVDTDDDGIIDENDDDDDNDGLPDVWEIKVGLDPLNKDDASQTNDDGKTYLEVYMEETASADNHDETEDEDYGSRWWLWLLLIFIIMAVLLGGGYGYMRSKGYHLNVGDLKKKVGGAFSGKKDQAASPQKPGTRPDPEVPKRTTIVRTASARPRPVRPTQTQVERRKLVSKFDK